MASTGRTPPGGGVTVPGNRTLDGFPGEANEAPVNTRGVGLLWIVLEEFNREGRHPTDVPVSPSLESYDSPSYDAGSCDPPSCVFASWSSAEAVGHVA